LIDTRKLSAALIITKMRLFFKIEIYNGTGIILYYYAFRVVAIPETLKDSGFFYLKKTGEENYGKEDLCR
jgi:hypothetical protein